MKLWMSVHVLCFSFRMAILCFPSVDTCKEARDTMKGKEYRDQTLKLRYLPCSPEYNCPSSKRILCSPFFDVLDHVKWLSEWLQAVSFKDNIFKTLHGCKSIFYSQHNLILHVVISCYLVLMSSCTINGQVHTCILCSATKSSKLVITERCANFEILPYL